MAVELKIDAARLEQHRIAAIDTATIASVFPRTVGRNSFRGSHGNGRRHEVIVVTTDRGKVGWGPPLGVAGGLARFVGRTVADLIDPGRGVVDEALSLDYPLHDLAGAILDLPVYRMLGDAGSKELPVYSGGSTSTTSIRPRHLQASRVSSAISLRTQRLAIATSS